MKTEIKETAWQERWSTFKDIFTNIDWKKPIQIFKIEHITSISINHKQDYIANTLAIAYHSKENYSYKRDDMPSAICIFFGWEKIFFSLGRIGPKGTKHHLIYVHKIDNEYGIKVYRYL